MAVDIAVLGLEVNSSGVVVASDRLKQLTAEGGKAEQATNQLSSSFANATKYIRAAVAAMASWKLTEYAKEATLLAARVETLGVVMGVVGNNAGYTSRQMQEYDKAVQKMGITTQESRANLIKMAGAQMDLAKSTQLARVAQDAAVIGNINSSEAFGRMIQGIRSGETEILKNIGINVQFEQAYKKSAATLGKTSEQMTGAEKVTARMNAVLDYGKNIAGAYAASMGTAGKQLNSMSRYTEELRLKFGETFTPALSFVVVELTNALKDADTTLGKNKSTVDEWGQNFKSVVVSVAAEITRLSMLIDKAGGSMTSAAMLLFAPGAAMGNENSKKQFERLAQANLDYEARYKAGEDRLTRLAMSEMNPGTTGRTSAQEQASIDAAAQRKAKEAAAEAAAASSKASKEAERYRQTVVELRKDIDLLSTSMSDHEKALFGASVEYDKLILKYPKHRAELEGLRAEKIRAIQTEQDLKTAIADTTKELAELQAQTEAMTAAERAYWQEIANTVKQVEGLQPGASVAAVEQQINAIYAMAEKLPDMADKAATAIDVLMKFKETEQEIQDINNGLIDDPYQRQLAQIEAFYQRKFDLIDQERNALMGLQDANKSNLDQYRKYQEKIEQLDDKEAALNRQKTRETTETHADAMRSQLFMAGFYTSVAGGMFSALAETQDQSSRKGFETAKAFNLAATVMNTASAIMNAYATVPWPASVAAAALAATTGATQIANIASTSFGDGAKAPSVPTGSFASGGAGGGSTGIGNMTSPLMSIQDSQSQESLTRLTESTDNAAVAIGRLSKSMDDLTALFESGGAGMTLAQNAPNQGVDTSRIKGTVEVLGDSFTSYLKDTFTGDLWGTVFKPWSTVGSLLFGGGWKTTDAGISLSVDSGVIDADTYEKRKKSGGLFSSSKKKYRYTENEDLDTYMSALVQPYTNDITRMAMTLGTNANLSEYSAPRTNISTAGRKPEDIAKDLEDWTLKTLQGMAMTVDGLEDVVGAYDDAYAKLKEYNDALVSTNKAFELIGKPTLQGSLKTGEFLSNFQQNLFGGMDEFNDAVDTYFTSLFTDSQQESMLAAQAQREVNSAFAEMQLSVPKTREEFISLVNGLDVTTESGAQTFAALMDVSESFGTVMEAADELAKKQRELDIQYMELSGDVSGAVAAQRQDELDALDASLRPLQERIYALQDEAKVSDLNIQIMELEGNTAEATAAKRAHELASMESSLRPLQERIYALQDEKEASEAAAAAEKQLADQRNSLQEQLDVLTGVRTEREIALGKITDDINKSMQERIYALQDEKAASDAAAAAEKQLADQRNSLQEQLDIATGKRTDREITLSKITDDVSASLQQQIWAAEDLKAATDAATEAIKNNLEQAKSNLQKSFDAEKERLTAAYDNELELMNSRLDAAKNTVSDLTSSLNKLTAARERMRLEDAAIDRQQYQAAQARLATVLTQARGGDLAGLKDIDGTLETLTGITADSYANSTDYQRDFYQTKNSITELEKLTSNQLTDAQKQLDLTQQQIDTLKANHDAQIRALDNQLNAILELNTTVMSIEDAIRQYQSAKAATQPANLQPYSTQDTPALRDEKVQAQNEISYSDSDTGLLAAAKALYASTHGGANSDYYNKAAAGVGGNIAVALGWDGSMEGTEALRVKYGFAQGVNQVPFDMVAQIHEGERIIPAADNYELMRRLETPATTADNSELVAEVRALRAELRAAQAEIAKNTQKTARYIERWDGDGIPEVRAA